MDKHSGLPFIDWSKYEQWLSNKYAPTWYPLVLSYSKKYYSLIHNVKDIDTLPKTIRSNVLKSLACLTKYLGIYDQFKSELKRYSIKWNVSSGLNVFMRLFNNNRHDIIDWYRQASNILKGSERLYLEFVLKTGLRPMEGVRAFNKIIELYKSNKLSEYFNEELCTLEHFRFKEFIRGTKNVYISIVPENLILKIANSSQVSYFTIRKHLRRGKTNIRIKELRSLYASFMVRHGLIHEEVDIIQGRVPKSIFVRHYLTIDFKNLSNRTLKALNELERQLN